MNILYTKAMALQATADLDWDNAGTVIKCMLERSTSTYTPDKDHDFRDDLTGFVEISVASYTSGGETLASKAVNIDDANDRVEIDFADIDFGTLEAGQTVDALVFYQDTGNAATDVLIAYIDTATGLPAVLGGGNFDVTIDSEGFIQISQA